MPTTSRARESAVKWLVRMLDNLIEAAEEEDFKLAPSSASPDQPQARQRQRQEQGGEREQRQEWQ